MTTVTPTTTTAPAKKPRRRAPWAVWRDPSGRLSWLRIVSLLFLFLPFFIAAYDYQFAGFVSPRPVNDVIHRTGYWALIFLLTSLAITPLRRIGRFGQLLDVRRMIGVGAFVYAAVHISLYVVDQKYDLLKVASEIALRLYLTIGFIALLGLTALAVTSTNGMVRRLGGMRWARLHQIVYVIGLLALIHFFQQTKADVWVPTFVAGLFTWMLGYRLFIKLKKTRGELSPWILLLLAVVVSALVFIVEAIGIAFVFKAPVLSVLKDSFDIDFEMLDSLRPGWYVLGAGLIVVLVDLVRARFAKPRRSGAVPAVVKPAAKPA
jgi:sulfoxide reductase heme-binding subunit YedZ